MSYFSHKYKVETEEQNARLIKRLQEQGTLPEEDPWEHVSPITGKPLLEDYQCTIPGCERLTYKIVVYKDSWGYFVKSKIVLCNFLFGTNDYHSRCHSCAKRAGIRREIQETKTV